MLLSISDSEQGILLISVVVLLLLLVFMPKMLEWFQGLFRKKNKRIIIRNLPE